MIFPMIAAISYLQRVIIESFEDKGWSEQVDAFHLEWGLDGPRVKKVGMVAHFPQLHKNVDDTHEVAARKCLFRPAKKQGGY